MQRIRATKGRALRSWNKEHFGNVQSNIQRLYNQLGLIEGLDTSEQHNKVEKRIRRNYDEKSASGGKSQGSLG